jgi:alpha-amylase/alpha-mannosidase (GH57 family)
LLFRVFLQLPITMTALIIHGHFYQPPREDPWTGEIERQPSAAPYHDWNERIHDECYRPNAFAHIIGEGGAVERTVNNYANISFNFGPTLLSWLERSHPQTYRRIIEADKISAQKRGGHGNAIAQAYGHAILPLSDERDQLTQVRWGLSDFRYRFEREPESLWLPETGCDEATLRVLIDQGLRFVILAPQQASRFRAVGSREWQSLGDRGIDTTRPYRYVDDNGRSIDIFFYNGPLAQAIAFEQALASSELLVGMFKQAAQAGPLVNVATDGETYGHHFKFGDLCLAHALEVEAREERFWITNYGQYLERNPPEFEVELKEFSSWSCAHGVERWREDCGCHTGGDYSWNQRWRGPLRKALDFLRDEVRQNFETYGTELLLDPWDARNSYIQVLLGAQPAEEFLKQHSRRLLSDTESKAALSLLEMQHNALLMFTSCAWFFSELSGIETVQIMKYAARVIELNQQLGFPSPRDRFLELLAEARSNIKERGTGADIYLREVEPVQVTFEPSFHEQ